MTRLFVETEDRVPRVWKMAVLFCIALFTAFAGLVRAGDAYSVRVGRYLTSEEAGAAKQRFSETCSPVYEVSTGNAAAPYGVAVGRFDLRSEAWVYSTRLTGDGGTTPTVTVLPAEPYGLLGGQTPTSTTETSLPVTMPFDTGSLQPGFHVDPLAHWAAEGIAELPEPGATLLAKSASEMTQSELLEVGLAASDKTVAIPALRQFLSAYSSASEINPVRLRLARLTGCGGTDDAYALLSSVRASGSTDETALADLIEAYMLTCRGNRRDAMTAFRTLASDEALAPSLRLEAMQRYARHAHALRDFPAAWLAFDQIERTAPDAATAADARMEKAGLAFELTSCAKGTWPETEALCNSVLRFDGASTKTKATAKLMYIEALYNQGRLQEAFDEVTSFLYDYREVPREYSVALVWKGVFLTALQRFDEGESVFAEVIAANIPEGEKFAGTEPKAYAAYWLAWLAART